MFLPMDHTTLIKGDDEVETTRLEMAGVREENLRLKTLLEQIEKDYKALQRRFNDIFRHGNRPPGGDDQEQELVSLRLGTMNQPEINKGRNSGGLDKVEIGGNNYELKLGMDYNSDRLRTEGVFQNPGLDEKWPPGKKGFKREGDQGFSQTSEKKARVCVRARCDTPTMNDGCQWRKYGQKISKGNPCPRAYYRCTISSSCPVRKQVQRCMDDTSVLITTYEGKHNHPLPLAATAMASTTSAAASMLLSGSSTSPATPIFFHGHPCNNLKSQTWPYNYTSPSAPFPTLTLDLTNTLNSSSPNTPFTLHSSCPGIPGTNPTISSSNPNNNKSPTEAFGYKNINDCEFSPPGKSGQDLNYQSCLEKLNQGALTNTLTEAITSDPSFKSVIAAALSTMVANRGPGKFNQGERVQNHGKDLIERGHHAPAAD